MTARIRALLLEASRHSIDSCRLESPTGGRWGAEAFITNALDKTYAATLGSGAGNGFCGDAMLGPPRQIGIGLNYRF